MRAHYLPQRVHKFMNGGADLEETSWRLQVNILFPANHSHAGPAARVAVCDADKVAVARIRHKTDTRLGMVLVHRLADYLLVLLGCRKTEREREINF